MVTPKNSKNSVNPVDKDLKSVVTILSEYAPLVKSRALKYLNNYCELDDLIQEGNIGLLTAASKYISGLSSFTTFAQRCIDASIIDYLRRLNKLSQIPKDLLVDIGDVQVVDFSADPEQTLTVKDEYLKVVERARLVLSKGEFAVFSYILRGFSSKEIALRLETGLKSVNNTVGRIRAKLK